MTNTEAPTTVGQQIKGARKGQRFLVDGRVLTYSHRLNGHIVWFAGTSDPIYMLPERVAKVKIYNP